MITYSNLGKKGNLGNQLFQIASTIGIADKNQQDYCFPFWEYSNYFDFQFNKCLANDNWTSVRERQFNYHNWDVSNGNFDLNGWLQSERYFSNVNIKNIFHFKSDFEKNLLEKYHYLFSKKTILVTVRRGDFVNNPNYFQLSYKFYLTALLHQFNNLQEYNIIFTSDSITYCKKHFSFLPNVFFLENLKPIEQLCLGSKFDHYIISNSTFSWWMAWLGEKDKTKIIRPKQIFDGEYSKKNDESDYFPKRWIVHDENDFELANSYWKLKIYGYLYELGAKMKYVFKSQKKIVKKRIKEILGYK
jgi:Glycosyl transferase family 11